MLTGDLVAELQASCEGLVHGERALGSHTTLRVGGPTRAFVVAEQDEDLRTVGTVCRERGLPWVIVGRGSNLLASDTGWPGVAVHLGRGFRGVELLDRGVRAGAAEPLPALAIRVADAGFSGFAWGCAVPGTVGGAVRMNAGAHGGEISQHLVEVDIIRLGTGVRETWPAEALSLGYRHSELPSDAVVVAATLAFSRAEPAEVRAEIAEIRSWRRRNQPLNQPNCGSVFTNPPGDSAGRLIELTGLKGLRRGGAQVSQRHANFIVTQPGATAEDVHALICTIQRRVLERTGVRLRPEVTQVGAFPPPGREGPGGDGPSEEVSV